MLLDEQSPEVFRLEEFSYPIVQASRVPAWEGLGLTVDGQVAARQNAPSASCGSEEEVLPDSADFQRRLAEECSRSYQAGHGRGFVEGTEAERMRAHEQAREEASSRLAGLDDRLMQAQALYFKVLEPQLARLALDIAARVLRREVRLDPLALTGAVRAALGQLAASTRVRLIVPAGDLSLWTESMALLPNLPVRPAVVPDEAMLAGECRLESDLGSADLSVKAQLEEIEWALFDEPGTQASGVGSGSDRS